MKESVYDLLKKLMSILLMIAISMPFCSQQVSADASENNIMPSTSSVAEYEIPWALPSQEDSKERVVPSVPSVAEHEIPWALLSQESLNARVVPPVPLEIECPRGYYKIDLESICPKEEIVLSFPAEPAADTLNNDDRTNVETDEVLSSAELPEADASNLNNEAEVRAETEETTLPSKKINKIKRFFIDKKNNAKMKIKSFANKVKTGITYSSVIALVGGELWLFFKIHEQ